MSRVDTHLRYSFLLLAALAASATAAPTRSNGTTDQLVGEWRGRSLCVTTTRPACTDEDAVYRITRDAPGKDAFHFEGNKLVNGEVQSMGDAIACRFEVTRQQLFCPMGSSMWQFRWEGRKLIGVLLDNGAPFRLIQVDKVKP